MCVYISLFTFYRDHQNVNSLGEYNVQRPKKHCVAYAYVICGHTEEKQRRTFRAKGRSETRRINRYRDTASMRKPTGQQLSEGAFSSLVRVLEKEMAGMYGEQVARLPTFRNLQRHRKKAVAYWQANEIFKQPRFNPQNIHNISIRKNYNKTTK